MASKKKERPLKGTGRDGRDYAEFMAGLLDGSIQATQLTETTVPDGTRDVTVEQYDANGNRLADVVVTVPTRRLTKLEYDEPGGQAPGVQAGLAPQGLEEPALEEPRALEEPEAQDELNR
jgi:hypothetical protein